MPVMYHDIIVCSILSYWTPLPGLTIMRSTICLIGVLLTVLRRQDISTFDIDYVK